MTEHILTKEQEAILRAVTETDKNLIISALAGAAKTSTLVLIAEELKNLPILCLAFNKKIQLEMQARLPTMSVSMTLNSLGHRAWSKQIGRRLVLKTDKMYNLVKDAIDTLSDLDKKQAISYFSEILKVVNDGKTAGYVPTGKFPDVKRLMNDDEFFEWLDPEPTELTEKIIKKVTYESILLGFQGEIDFNDQIFLPTIFPCSFPQYPLVMIDEAQDLSLLNHMMLKKIAKRRVIAVGDPCQSIYGFRGAHQNSMDLLMKQFNMEILSLTISFRCPKEVVKVARIRAPTMKYPENAKEGRVTYTNSWNLDLIPDNSAVICRNNAPLFKAALLILRKGRYPKLYGNEIGKALVKVLKKFGKSDMSQEDVIEKIEVWKEKKLTRSREPEKIHDMADCLQIFAEQGENLGEILAYSNHLINSEGSIALMTGHKAKGLEFNDVFFLDSHLIGNSQQEKNLCYVIQTRAMNSLTYLNSDEYEMEDI